MSKYRDTEFFQKHLADLTALEQANLMLVLIDQGLMPDFYEMLKALDKVTSEAEHTQILIKKHLKQPR